MHQLTDEFDELNELKDRLDALDVLNNNFVSLITISYYPVII